MDKNKVAVGRLKFPKSNKNNSCKFSSLVATFVLVSVFMTLMTFNFQSKKADLNFVDLVVVKSTKAPTIVTTFAPTSFQKETVLTLNPSNFLDETSAMTNNKTIKSVKLKAKKELNKKKVNAKAKGKRKPKDPFDFVNNIDSDWGFRGEHKYITVLPTLKMDIKKDRRVIFPNLTMTLPFRSREPSTDVLGTPRELLKANEILKRHPMHQIQHNNKELPDIMFYIKNTALCLDQPVYLSMATVHDDLYWQLIENFVYTMVKFNQSACSIVICVSDPKCMRLCEEAHFPCFDYVEHTLPLPSVMEQIAAVKLLHVPKAIERGVDVFMLDLDVGFLEDPKHMVTAFRETPIVDIMVQEDYIFIMNRSTWLDGRGYKSWFTEPLPNIGLFLCRGNNRTAQVFRHAWGKYLTMNDPIEKSMPGKDQNHVLDAMRIGRGNYGLKYAYFSNSTAPLLDKLVMNHGNVMELGGELMAAFLHTLKSVAMHTTCYEKSTKVMGLKATNSFWNPRYYDPLRPTLTKQILFRDDAQLLDEVRSLVWLAISTGRSLIVPNILGDENMKTIASYRKQVMWPGFRVVFLKREKGRNQLKVTILEPAYYWRVERDYDAAPTPHVVYFDDQKNSLFDVRDKLLSSEHKIFSRVVLHSLKENLHPTGPVDLNTLSADSVIGAIERAVSIWANDSVGYFTQPYSTLIRSYKRIPSVKSVRADPLAGEVLQGMRNCANIWKTLGNRTCFQICD